MDTYGTKAAGKCEKSSYRSGEPVLSPARFQGLRHNPRKARQEDRKRSGTGHKTQVGTQKEPKKAVCKIPVPVYESGISRWQKIRQSFHGQKSEGLYKKSAHIFEISRGWGTPIFFAIFFTHGTG